MPDRRQWWWLLLLVLGLHSVVLLGLPLRAAPLAPVPAAVFATRMLPAPVAEPAPEAVEVPEVQTPPAAPPKPAPKKPPAKKPLPPPAEVQAPPPALTPEPSAAPELASGSDAPDAAVSEEANTQDAVAVPADAPSPTQAADSAALAGSAVVLASAHDAPPAPVVLAQAAAQKEPTPAAPTPAPPVRLPPSTLLSFDVRGQAKKMNYSASAELLWQHDGASYQARQQVKVFLLGTRLQTSVGTLTAQGLLPTRFGDKSRSEKAAHFDYEQGQIIFSSSSERPPLPSGAQDRLSVFIQLGAMLAAAPERYPPGSQITLTTVGVRSADPWTFTVEAAETLDLPIGATPALRLQRLPRKAWDQHAELWLGRDLNYLPVRIRLTQESGDFVDLLLNEHSQP